MKPDLTYFLLALSAWCKEHRWDKDLPITPSWLLEVLTRASELRDTDRKKLETEPPTV